MRSEVENKCLEQRKMKKKKEIRREDRARGDIRIEMAW